MEEGCLGCGARAARRTSSGQRQRGEGGRRESGTDRRSSQVHILGSKPEALAGLALLFVSSFSHSVRARIVRLPVVFSSSLLCRGNCTLPRPTADAATSNTPIVPMHSCVDDRSERVSLLMCVLLFTVCLSVCWGAHALMGSSTYTVCTDQPLLSFLPSLSLSPFGGF